MRRSFIWAALLVCLAVSASAQDRLVSYQGYLTTPDGAPVADGTYQLTFGIYTDSTGGTQLWGETNSSVYVSDGNFQVMLGGIVPLSASVFEYDDLFLQIQVGGDSPIQPRTRLGSVPRAAVSDRVAGDIETGPGYTHFKGSDGSTSVTIGEEGKGGPGFMSFYNPNLGFEGQTLLHLRTEETRSALEFMIPGDVPPGPCIRMGVDPEPFRAALVFYDPTGAFPFDPYIRMGVEPSPFNGAYLEFHDASSGFTDRPLLKMGTEPSPFKGSIKMFNPQPEPPARVLEMAVGDETGEYNPRFSMYTVDDGVTERELFQMTTSPTDGFSARMFNPQPEPPARAIWEMSSNDFGGMSWVMFNPQPEPPGAVFNLETNFAGRSDEVTMELTDTDTDIQTKLTPGRVKVGSDVDDSNAKGELQCGNDSTTFYIQGSGAVAPGPMIGMLASSSEVKMGIGTQTPSAELHVVGDICYTGSIGACSDGRYKQDVYTLDGALEKIDQLRGVNYRWRQSEYPDKRFDDAEHVGFIAQEVQEVLPEIVQEHADGSLAVDYGRLTPLLVEAIKELINENKELRQRIETLESK